MRLTQLEGAELYGADGAHLGRVQHVLFHPTRPQAVALMVRRRALFYVLPRSPRFVAWSSAKPEERHLRLDTPKLPSRRKAEKAIGHDPEETVIWRGMPVISRRGNRVGVLHDASVARDGSVGGLTISTGAMGDLAFGRLDVPGNLVEGFDGSAVVVTAEADDLASGGGLTKKAAQGTVAAQRKATQATAAVKQKVAEKSAASEAGLTDASKAVGRAIGKAAATPTGKKARKVARGFASALREALKGDDE